MLFRSSLSALAVSALVTVASMAGSSWQIWNGTRSKFCERCRAVERPRGVCAYLRRIAARRNAAHRATALRDATQRNGSFIYFIGATHRPATLRFAPQRNGSFIYVSRRTTPRRTAPRRTATQRNGFFVYSIDAARRNTSPRDASLRNAPQRNGSFIYFVNEIGRAHV